MIVSLGDVIGHRTGSLNSSSKNEEKWRVIEVSNDDGKGVKSVVDVVQLERSKPPEFKTHTNTTTHFVVIDGNPKFEAEGEKIQQLNVDTAVTVLPMQRYRFWNEYIKEVKMFVFSVTAHESEEAKAIA